ncbi:MAG: MATE family efflux transporter [Actinomycetota bacterium]|nr:MATE family efflux transporter [Actinomycetota bacterium]
MADPSDYRRILALTVPALGVLAAEPLYLLVDTAVVGHLGATALGGLALGAVVVSLVVAPASFLEYGTTGRAARLHGAGRRRDAVNEGVQATWLALIAGVLLLIAGELFAGRLIGALAGGTTEVRHGAEVWLRVALIGLPGVLVTLAGNGWMRGVQETRRPLVIVLGANLLSAGLSPLLVYPAHLGLLGSAVANVCAQAVAMALFLRALVKEDVPLRPQWTIIRRQLVIGRDLVLRTAVFQVNFLVAASVAARMGAAQVAAHQIGMQLWTFLALVLDAYAIAAQSLVGAALGGGRPEDARAVAWRATRLGMATGTVFAALLLAGWYLLPALFTGDSEVRAQAHVVWPWLAAMQPVAGAVFALDGVLIGAGDVGFLRTVTAVAGLGGFLPLTLLTAALGWGLGGIWAGLTLFVVIRLVGMVRRIRGSRWALAGVG